MPILQYEYPFTCPNCKTRSSQTTIDYKCKACGHDVKVVANRSQGDLYPLILFLFTFLVVFTLMELVSKTNCIAN